ncbi:zinc-dependent alcohol dehydrogenase [Arthrobacter sp. TE12232]
MKTSTLGRGVAWAGPEKLLIEDRPWSTPAPDEVVIRIESIGVCGTDVSIWRGNYPGVPAGTVLGHEFGGTIVEVGANVTDRSTGQLVAVDPNIVCGHCLDCATGSRALCSERRLMGRDLDGGLQSFLAVDAAQTIAVPGTPDPRALALVEPIAVGVHACARAGVTAGTRLGIIGGGAIGMAGALQARSLGAESITVVEPDALRRATIEEYGVTAIAPGDVPEQRWNVAIDTVGNGATISAVMELMEPGSTICVAGLAPGGTLPTAQELVRRELTLTGTFCYTTADLLTAAELVAAHGLTALPNDLIHGFDAVPAAIQAFALGHLGRGKTIIIP